MQTKFFVPPPRANLVTRQHLIDRLNLGLNRKLSLVSAPAGFGKTTLISAWLAQLPADFAISWLSLDEEDSEISRFFFYFIRALQSVHPAIGQDLLPVTPLPPPESVVSILLNQISKLNQKWVLVLDDYQMITLPEVHRTLEMLLEFLPQHMHLVLISRADPPFSISKYRVRHQLVEIRARDLRFTQTETTEFLNQSMAFNLDPEEVTLLSERTEGWIAALQLASHSLSFAEDRKAYITAFAGDDRYIADYLVEEVLSNQNEDVQAFLLKTSILSTFNSSLCAALLQRQGSQEILGYLDRSNLFVVPLDNKRQWYRYHHLFRDLLRERLAVNPEEIRHLHRLAGNWFIEHERTLEAVDHFLSAEDFEDAVRVILSASIEIFISGQIPALTRLWFRFPPDQVLSNPEFCMMMAWAFLATGNPTEAEGCLQAIERSLGEPMRSLVDHIDSLAPEIRNGLIEVAVVRMSFQSVARVDKTEILSLCEHILPYLVQGDQVHLYNPSFSLRPVVMFNIGLAYKALARHKEAFDALNESILLGSELGNIHIVAPALGHLAEIAMAQGKLQRAADICRQGLVKLDHLGGEKSPLTGMLHVILGQLHYEWNELDIAVKQFEEGIKMAKPWQNREALLPGFEGLIRAYRSQGAFDNAAAIYQEFTDLPLDNSLEEPLIDAYKAFIHLQQGNPESARAWANTWLLNEKTVSNELEGVIMVHVQLQLGNASEAASLAASLSQSAEENKNWGRVVELLVLQSRALAELEAWEEARILLYRGLDLAEKEGYVRLFLDNGDQIKRLVETGLKNGDAPPYTAQITAAFQAIQPGSPPTLVVPKAIDLVETLSEREIEVLRLIEEGLSNRQIAERLYLSVGTIKVHAHNIFGKLGVSGRTQAAKRARELGYL